jgi:hypothetical protein
MGEQRIGTREEWQAARDELAKIEAEQRTPKPQPEEPRTFRKDEYPG